MHPPVKTAPHHSCMRYYFTREGRIWDRGALVAVRLEDREDYVATCDSLLEPGGRILLGTLVYDQEKMKGEGLGRFLPELSTTTHKIM